MSLNNLKGWRMQSHLASWLMLIGGTMLVIGILVKLGVFSWFGHLPGDFHFKREGFQFYFPLSTMILVSIVLSLVLAVIRKLF